MSIERVRNYFKTLGEEERIRTFDVSSATVQLAAEALNCEPKRIAKTLSFLISDKPVLIVAAGDAKVDNKLFKKRFMTKAKMIPFDDVEAYIGHAAGGVCPFAVNDGVRVFLDVSVKRFDTVFPAAGSANSAIELSIPELEKYSGYEEWVEVFTIPEEE